MNVKHKTEKFLGPMFECMTLEHSLLGYMAMLNIKEVQDGLTLQERQIGATHIIGCLGSIATQLKRQRDQISLSLVRSIRAREVISDRVCDEENKELIKATEECARQVYEYYTERIKADHV